MLRRMESESCQQHFISGVRRAAEDHFCFSSSNSISFTPSRWVRINSLRMSTHETMSTCACSVRLACWHLQYPLRCASRRKAGPPSRRQDSSASRRPIADQERHVMEVTVMFGLFSTSLRTARWVISGSNSAKNSWSTLRRKWLNRPSSFQVRFLASRKV
jgi:hypothetical protein